VVERTLIVDESRGKFLLREQGILGFTLARGATSRRPGPAAAHGSSAKFREAAANSGHSPTYSAKNCTPRTRCSRRPGL